MTVVGRAREGDAGWRGGNVARAQRGFGSADYYARLYALNLLHIDPKRVIWLQIGTETERLAALKAKQIQFTILIVGMDTAALAAGFQPLLKLYRRNNRISTPRSPCTSRGRRPTKPSSRTS